MEVRSMEHGSMGDVPYPLQVVSSEFAHFRGGKEILDNSESLRAKVELHLAEVAKAEANGSHAG